MITKKVFYIDAPCHEVLKLMFDCSIDILNHLPEKHSYYVSGGIRVGIIPMNNGTRITISRRSERENIHTFQTTIISIERKIKSLNFKQSRYGKI